MIVLATVCLHNFIMKQEGHAQSFKQYCLPTYVDHVNENGDWEPGEWRGEARKNNFQDLGRCGGNRPALGAIQQRDMLAQYFLSEAGSVEWQWRSTFRGFEVNVLT